MHRRLLHSLVFCACLAHAACGGDASPSAPSPGTASTLDGQWSGSTSQGRPLTFTVSKSRVTTMSIGYSFNGCAGTASADIDAEISDVRNTPRPPPDPYF